MAKQGLPSKRAPIQADPPSCIQAKCRSAASESVSDNKRCSQFPGIPDISERGPVPAPEFYIDSTDVRQRTKQSGFEQSPLSSIDVIASDIGPSRGIPQIWIPLALNLSSPIECYSVGIYTANCSIRRGRILRWEHQPCGVIIN